MPLGLTLRFLPSWEGSSSVVSRWDREVFEGIETLGEWADDDSRLSVTDNDEVTIHVETLSGVRGVETS
jgi:hypothetical protein